MTYKTPGVYVKEIPLFPPSVAQVETAVPAFVGYTERASGTGGKSLTDTPVRIKSLVEFEALFGGGHLPALYKVYVDGANNNALLAVSPDKRFYLYDALRQFYDNGGGRCYIVSVGSYTDTSAIEFGTLEQGVNLLRQVDEPTLLLAPDAVGLSDPAEFGDLQQLMLNQCAALQDRFAILDLLTDDRVQATHPTAVDHFRDNIGINNLSYGAAYHPWLVTHYPCALTFRQLRLFKRMAQGVDTPYAPYADDEPVATMTRRMADTDSVLVTGEPGVNSDTLLARGSASLREILAEYQETIATHSNEAATAITDYLNLLRSIALSFPRVRGHAVTTVSTDFLKEVDVLRLDTKLISALERLVAIEKNPTTVANTTRAGGVDLVESSYAPLYETLGASWLAGKIFDDIPGSDDQFTHNSDGCRAIIAALADATGKILSSYQQLLDSARHFEREAEQALFTGHPFYRSVRERITRQMRTLPPSGAVAGLYAATDASRGVWKAPANIRIAGVIGPDVKLDNEEQGALNVHPTGKSINAIRAFTGKGTLVWGARTLAGNSGEWCYVPVRRFFIMVEESVKRVSEPFVFEPNDANTWVKLRGMVENFLTLQWRAGALQGAKPEEAFFVHIGLGQTMTDLDILDGRMIVEIGMAAVRPAEFIVLRFSHTMQSG